MFEEERVDSIFGAYIKLIIPSFIIGMIFGAFITVLILWI
jgi:hypothetical protein